MASAEATMRKVIATVIALISVLAGCSRPWQSSSVEPVPPSLDASYASPRAGAYGAPPWADASERERSTEQFGGAPPPPAPYSNEYGEAPRSLDPYGLCAYPLMIESAKLDRLLTQVNCRIARFARLRDARAISERKAEQQLKQAVEFRVELMRQIDGLNFVFDA